MNSSKMYLFCSLALACVFLRAVPLHAGDDSFKAPDSIVLKNGKVVRGLILRNTRDAVLMQEKFREVSYPKSEIVRIRDEADLGIEFTDINRHGDLPSWRVIANDLRSQDRIKEVSEIPATIIDNGVFRNVPYKSFRVNTFVEMNIFGDPEDPSGLEFGVYGVRANIKRAKETLRNYLSGFLTSRAEVAALYSLPFSGGSKKVGDLTISITPRNAPDAYGAWWISIYNEKELNELRLSDEEYARLARPFREVVNPLGRVKPQYWTKKEAGLSGKIEQLGDSAMVLFRGFYRDKNGDFRPILDKASTSAAN